jgi:hypothetical protein
MDFKIFFFSGKGKKEMKWHATLMNATFKITLLIIHRDK